MRKYSNIVTKEKEYVAHQRRRTGKLRNNKLELLYLFNRYKYAKEPEKTDKCTNFYI